MKKSNEYALEVAKLSSHTDYTLVDGLINTMTANFCYKNTQLAGLTVKRARFIDLKQSEVDEKGKRPSIASCKNAWEATDDGQDRILLKAEVENMKNLIKAVENQGFSIRMEAKLTNNS